MFVVLGTHHAPANMGFFQLALMAQALHGTHMGISMCRIYNNIILLYLLFLTVILFVLNVLCFMFMFCCTFIIIVVIVD